MKNEMKEDFLKFLGTAGARFVMIKQLRSSGGLWLKYRGTNIIIDPGPGALVRTTRARPKLDATSLSGIILTHQHLDHSNDINVMIEAMTEGGFKKKGVVFAPASALDPVDGVVFEYVKKYPEKICVLKEGDFKIGDIAFRVPVRNQHSVETYGVKFLLGEEIISVVSDTNYSDGIIDAYRDSTVLVLNVVFKEPRDTYEHLSIPEAIEITRRINPKLALFTHFGMMVLRSGAKKTEEKIRKEEGLNIIFAYDGLTLPLPYQQ